MTDDKKAKARESLRAATELLKAFREKYPDSPLAGVAFHAAALAGKIECALNAEKSA